MSHSHYGVITISKEELAKLLGFEEGQVIDVGFDIWRNRLLILVEDDGFPESKKGQGILEYAYPPDR